MSTLYPIRFQPIFRRYIWGGRRLATLLGKSIGDDRTCAESWEVVDHGGDQSVVANGPCAGSRLTDLIRQHPAELLGHHQNLDRFPLLFKFLDAHRTLSVQVHPNDIQAAELDPPDWGKTEAWIVLAAEPGSKIYGGLKRGIDRAALGREVVRGTCELCLHAFEPDPGDCVFIPAGTVHALGAGLVIAEIQQASDTTFRLFDWNRVDEAGRPRQLHVDQALDVIDFARGPVGPIVPTKSEHEHIERLIECEKFVIDRWRLTQDWPVGGDRRFHVLAVVEGIVELAADHQTGPLRTGSVCLLPASAGPVTVSPLESAVLIDAWLP